MASLKPTMSTDGLKRATVQVSYRIDIDELAVVATRVINCKNFCKVPSLSRRKNSKRNCPSGCYTTSKAVSTK